MAAPLFELYDNSQGYGPIISSLPQTMSRLLKVNFHFMVVIRSLNIFEFLFNKFLDMSRNEGLLRTRGELLELSFCILLVRYIVRHRRSG